jgi:tetratricopeptide (TPR) repeat protein
MAGEQARIRGRRTVGIALMLVVTCPIASGIGSARGQTSSGSDGALAPVVSALNRGRLDEADGLLRKLDGRDPDVVALRARILLTRGRSANVEPVLGEAAARAPTSEAALQLGTWLVSVGRPKDAAKTLEPILAAASRFNEPRQFARAGRAAQALNRFDEANAYLREAATSAPDNPDIQTAWGELFLEAHNQPEAMRSFQAALTANPAWTDAHLGIARVMADQDNLAGALSAAAKALALNPSSVPAHLFVAESMFALGQPVAARREVTRALELDPTSPAAHRLLAASAYVQGRMGEFQSEVERVRAVNPADSEVYRMTASLLAGSYRFDEAVILARQAVGADASNARAQADLGMHLLRAGDEAGARQALDAAFKLDRYNVVTFNLLSLLDVLDKFTTIQAGKLTVRLDPSEAPVMRAYVVPLAAEALTKLSALYGVDPTGPILVEVFPHHDDFAVRNLGLPGLLGALGACFGRVVTIDSPHAREPGTFDWRPTLWHEMAHVVTLQLSKQRIPRWLTEGISVYEEKRARPEWGRHQEVGLAQAIERKGAPLTIGEMDAAITNPATISLAYYTASLVVEHIVERFGQPALRNLVAAYGEGLQGDAAFERGLGVRMEALQKSFDAAVEEQFGPLRQALRVPSGIDVDGASAEYLRDAAALFPGSFAVQMGLGRTLRVSGDRAGAAAAFARATQVVPAAVGTSGPRAQMADIALELGDRETGLRLLEEELAHDNANISLARRLAIVWGGEGDRGRIQAVYEQIAGLDPFDSEAHTFLGRFGMDRHDTGTALREFRAALDTAPGDIASAHCDLAEALAASGSPADAKREVIAALETAPTYERAQELLLKLIDGRDATTARRERSE